MPIPLRLGDMKAFKIYVLLLSLGWIYSCGLDEEPNMEGNAEVVISVATRGGYQFLIKFNDRLYYPENLPEEFRVVTQEPIPVHIKFQLLDYQQDIFYPAPNDVPVFLKSIPVIKLLVIENI